MTVPLKEEQTVREELTRLLFRDLNPGDKIFINDGQFDYQHIMGCPVGRNDFISVLMHVESKSSPSMGYVLEDHEAVLGQKYWFYSNPDNSVVDYLGLISGDIVSISVERMKYDFQPELVAPPEAKWIYRIEPYHKVYYRHMIDEIEPRDKLFVHFFDSRKIYHIELLEIVDFKTEQKNIEVRRTFASQVDGLKTEQMYLDCEHNTRVGSSMEIYFPPINSRAGESLIYLYVCGLQLLKPK